MKINYGPGAQQLGSSISQIGGAFMQVGLQKAQQNEETLKLKYEADSQMAKLKMGNYASDWMSDPTNLAPEGGDAMAVSEKKKKDFNEYFGSESTTLFNDPRHAEQFLESSMPFLSEKYSHDALSSAQAVYVEQTVTQATTAAEDMMKNPTEDIDTTKKDVYRQYQIIHAAAGIKDPEGAIKAADAAIDNSFVTRHVQGLLQDGMSENDIFSVIDKLAGSDHEEVIPGLSTPYDIAKASALKEAVIKARDAQFEGTLANIQGTIAMSKDTGTPYNTKDIDDLISTAPVRHKLKLYKEKNTANSNNDAITYAGITKQINKGIDFTANDWKSIQSLSDPKKSDELVENMLVSKGQSLLASGVSLVEARAMIDTFEGPVSSSNRVNAKALIAKAYLDSESDVSKVAKDLLSSAGYDPGTVVQIPEADYNTMVQEGIRSAPPVDEARLEAEGEEYVEVQVQNVVQSLLGSAPNISLGGFSQVVPKVVGNIEIEGRPQVQNEDGSVSTVRTISIEEDGLEVVIPTVVNGEVVSEEEAIDHYHETDEHLGKFGTVEDAVQFAEDLHKSEEAKLDAAEPIAREIVDQQIEAVESPQEASWMPAYQAKVKERREELKKERASREAKLSAQAKKVQEQAGVSLLDDPDPARLPLNNSMTQENLVTNMLQIIKDGNGRHITPTEMGLIRDDNFREELTVMASTRDSFVIDSNLALDFIDQLRRDSNVTSNALVSVVSSFVEKGLIKASTGQDLTKKYSFAENPNEELLKDAKSSALDGAYPPVSGQVFSKEKSALMRKLGPAIDKAITMNPDLMGKDFALLEKQIENFTYKAKVGEIITNLGKVSKYLADDSVSKQIDNLERDDVYTFMQDVKDGEYDLLINYDFVSSNTMRASRHDPKNVIMDKVAKGMTAYKDFKDLSDNGTQFEKVQVMANANFILSGGVLENSLIGSFGIHPSDMKVAGKQWAFSDPEADGLYFIATDTDTKNRGTLGWGMCTADSDGVSNMIMFRDYVDPKLAYDIDSLQKQIDSPLFKDAKKLADAQKNVSPLGMGGLGISPVKIQKDLNAKYYGVIDEHKSKTEELNGLIEDIMTYRYNLLGMDAASLPTRL